METLAAGSNNVSILISDGKGGLTPVINLPVGLSPVWVVAGDFNGDQRPDLAVANRDSGDVSILISSDPVRQAGPRPVGSLYT